MAETSVDERACGITCLNGNDSAGAARHFWTALASGAAASDVPHYLGLSLFLSGDDDGLLRLVEACATPIELAPSIRRGILIRKCNLVV